MALTPTEIPREMFFCCLNSVSLNLEVAVGYYSNSRFWFKGVCHADRIGSLFLSLEGSFQLCPLGQHRSYLTFLQYIKRCQRQCRTWHHFSASLMKALLCLSPYLSLSSFSHEMIKYF